MTLGVRTKLLLSFVGLAVFAVSSILWVSSVSVEKQIRDEIEKNFEENGRIFERIQDVRFRQLRQTAILLADIPSLKAAIQTGDSITVAYKLREELRYVLDVDPIIPDEDIPDVFYDDPNQAGLLVVTDVKGKTMAQLATGEPPNSRVMMLGGVDEALQGNFPRKSRLWEHKGRYFNVVSVPIQTNAGLLGSLSYGFPIRNMEAVQLSKDLGNSVSYFINGQLVATAQPFNHDQDRSDFAQSIHNATFKADKSQKAQIEVWNSSSDSWLLYVVPMQIDINEINLIKGYYVVTKSLTESLVPLNQLQRIIFFAGFGIIVFAGALSLYLAERFTKPIYNLIDGIRRIEEGNYVTQVEVQGKDELSLLTQTFNSLVGNLRERLEMLKFVSQATLDAIKSNLTAIQLGGRRTEVAIFFSDIRGFTKWSEKRAPEEVIEMLNTFLRFQAEIVKSHQGDVDKFVGDELVAVFQGNDKEKNAVNAAIKIQQYRRHVQDSLGTSEIAIGIGINAGAVVMGAMGSNDRMDYTVLGNNVNLGARLCSAAQPHQILITEAVAENLERKVQVQPLQPIQVKGIEKPVQIFEVSWEVHVETI